MLQTLYKSWDVFLVLLCFFSACCIFGSPEVSMATFGSFYNWSNCTVAVFGCLTVKGVLKVCSEVGKRVIIWLLPLQSVFLNGNDWHSAMPCNVFWCFYTCVSVLMSVKDDYGFYDDGRDFEYVLFDGGQADMSDTDEARQSDRSGAGSEKPTRVRVEFPETWLWSNLVTGYRLSLMAVCTLLKCAVGSLYSLSACFRHFSAYLHIKFSASAHANIYMGISRTGIT